MDKETLVRAYSFPHEAQLAVEYLLEHGVKARLTDDVFIGMAPHLDLAAGGIKLRVPHAQADYARELLDALDHAPVADAADDADDADDEADGELTARDDELAARAFRSAIVGLLLCPGLMHLHSLGQLSGIDLTRLSPTGRRQRRAALLINWTVVVLLCAGVVRTLVGWSDGEGLSRRLGPSPSAAT